MSSDWPEVPLGDVVDLLTGFPFKSDCYTSDPRDPRLLGGDNIVQGRLRWTSTRHWPREKTEGLGDYELANGDVVLAMDRPWIEAGLKYGTVRTHDLPALLIQRTARLRGTERLDSRFLRYIIGSQAFTNHVLAVQTGTAVPHISPSQIREFLFRLPPLDTQRRVADLLGTLDDKIDLNRRMNETLEAIALALFKSWFVHFDPVHSRASGKEPPGLDSATARLFPTEFESDLPKGWRVGRLEELQADGTNAITAGPFGSKLVRADYVASGVPVIRGCNLAREPGHWFCEDEFVFVSPQKADRDLASCVARPGDVLFTQRGTLGQIGLIPYDAEHSRYVVSQSQMKMSCAAGVPPEFIVLHFLQESTIEYIKGNAVAAGVPHINLGFLRRLPVLVPSKAVLDAFGMRVQPLQTRMRHNTREAGTLMALRDALLPRLLSGELRVSQAERIAAG